jgi:hypothetical protein
MDRNLPDRYAPKFRREMVKRMGEKKSGWVEEKVEEGERERKREWALDGWMDVVSPKASRGGLGR